MKTALFASVIGLCLVATPYAAGAQGCPMGRGPRAGAGPGMGMGMGAGMGMMGQRQGMMLLAPTELPALKDKLAVTAEQMPAWTAYADAVDAVWNYDGARGPAFHDVHVRMWDARAALAKTLSADQRQVLDQSVPAPCRRF